MKIVRSRAPLRLGFGGGGTDVSPYCDRYGGCVLNATIDLFSNCTIIRDPKASILLFNAYDLGETVELPLTSCCALDDPLRLHKAVYNRVVQEFNHGTPLPVSVSTWSEAPPGSGLGTSSTLVVAMVAAYQELLNLPLGEYDISRLAFEIERIDCGLAGGKQDQYAATFGGFNFMEFFQDDRVIVNPLRIRRNIELELESSLLLYFTGKSRESARIIEDQARSAGVDGQADDKAVQAMHEVKAMAGHMKEAILKGDIPGFHRLLGAGWEAKKRMAKSISTGHIEDVATKALDAGAKSVKISGAGGGGFMMISVEPIDRHKVMTALKNDGGLFHEFRFTNAGVETWRAK